MSKATKIPITRRALIQRLQRALKEDELILRAARNERVRQEMGDYYTIDLRTSGVMERDVDLEDIAREYGVLKDYEKLEAE